MVQKIYIARHGFRLNWVTTTWESPTGLARDPPLTAYGETQAEELAEYFLSLSEEDRPTTIFSSPYYRCLQTSAPVAKALGIPIYVEHGIAEWYSPVTPGTGLHPRPGSNDSLKTFFSSVDSSWSTVCYPSRKGETVEELHDRIDALLPAFAFAMAQRLPMEKRQKILLVTHAATAIALARCLAGDRDLPMRAGCCSLSELDRKTQEEGVKEGQVLAAYRTVLLASGEHLKDGATREWGFEDIVVDQGRVVEDPGVPGSEGEKDEPVGLQIHVASSSL